MIAVNTLEAMGYEGEAAFHELIGQQATLVLKAPRGDAQSYTFRIAGVVETHYEAHIHQAFRVRLSARLTSRNAIISLGGSWIARATASARRVSISAF